MIGPIVLVAYTLVFSGLIAYSLHRGWLLFTYRRLARNGSTPGTWSGPWPSITVQLPIYYERFVVERLLDAVASLDYPRDRLEIHVLDDSDDETLQLAIRRVEHHARRGIDIERIEFEATAGEQASLSALIGFTQSLRNLIFQLAGVDLVLPAAEDFSTRSHQNRVGDRAFPFGIKRLGKLVAVV